MNSIDVYLNSIKEIMDSVFKNQREAIEKTSVVFAEAIKNKKSIFVFGCTHAGIIAEEMFYRAGGLAVINPLFNPALMCNVRPITQTSHFERLSGQSAAILDSSPADSGDVILIHSVSGRNNAPIEMALRAKEKGMTTIALTNIAYSSSSKSKHICGKRLFEVCDIYIDNGGEFGDSSVKLDGVNEKTGATSTVIGATIVNSISVRTAEILIENGITPPILHSANADGGDEINKKIFKEYQNCIHYL